MIALFVIIFCQFDIKSRLCFISMTNSLVEVIDGEIVAYLIIANGHFVWKISFFILIGSNSLFGPVIHALKMLKQQKHPKTKLSSS